MMVICIYGCGGLGRETAELIKIVNANKRWDNIIFIEDNPSKQFVNDISVYGTKDLLTYFNKEDIEVVIAVGEPAVREKMKNNILSMGLKLATIIHPEIIVPKTTIICDGVVINQGCYLSCNVEIKSNVFLQQSVIIGHDTKINENTLLSAHSFVGGNCVLGKNTYIGPNSSIKEAIIVGDNCIVGMGSMVFKDIPNTMTVLGNPARIIAKNNDGKVF